MEVRPGYKQTEVGVIPEDWEVKPLNTLADKIMVGIASAATHAYRDKGIILFRNQNIKPGYLDDSDVLHITPEYEVTFKNKRLKAGDLLTARTGYPGTTCVVPAQYEAAQSFTTLITRPNHRVVDADYLCFYINSKQGQTYFEQNQIGGGQKNVNAGSLEKLPVPLPPTKAEQEAIAEALSDADVLIESLEQLSAKKRQIKQGAMQELLRSKDGWVKERLGSLATLINGRAYSITEWEDRGTPVIRLQNLTGRGEAFYYSNLSLPEKQYCHNGDLLFMWSATFGPIIWRGPKAIFHYHIWKIECQPKKLNKEFLFHLLSDITEKLKRESTSGGTMLHLTKSGMKAMEISIPDYVEQETIGVILSDMDAEIAALEAKLAKARQLKQGMMHNLLTGRIRLV